MDYNIPLDVVNPNSSIIELKTILLIRVRICASIPRIFNMGDNAPLWEFETFRGERQKKNQKKIGGVEMAWGLWAD